MQKILLFVILSITSSAFGLTKQSFTLSSPAFANNQPIPAKYTCDGENISPQLKWENAPKGTKSFALIVDDPDAPEKVWVHWLLFNIPATATNLPEAASSENFISGETDFYYMRNGVWQYGGPCPPSGTHHYHFTLYALDTALSLTADTDKETLLATMQDHILGTAILIGTYQRKTSK